MSPYFLFRRVVGVTVGTLMLGALVVVPNAALPGTALAGPVEQGFIRGLRSRSAGGTIVEVGPGVARDTTDTEFLGIPAGESRMVDTTTTGLGGLDEGVVMPNTSYALWIVAGVDTVGQVLASRSFDGVDLVLPPGGKFMRRIGSFSTDEQGLVNQFRQIGMGNDREVHYKKDRAALMILRDGRARMFTSVPFGHLAPVTLETVFVGVVPDNSSVTVRTGSSVAQTFSGPGVGTFLDGIGGDLDYRNDRPGGRTDLYVTGYSETL